MRKLLPVFMLLLFVQPVAADDAKPNTLTAKEIADGWVLLFDGETTFGWKLEGDGKATVDSGILTVIGGSSNKPTLLTLNTVLSACEIQFKTQIPTAMPPSEPIELGFSRGGIVTDVAVPLFYVNPAKWTTYTIKVERKGIIHELQHADGELIIDKTRSAPDNFPDAHRIRFQIPKDGKVMLQNIKVKPLGLRSIFNGKDLTGWKEIPGKKSKIAVTSEGWLNVKDGNGDLQTEGQWDDFVLQLDIISNGDHLNSGVFFRALPGEFWSGYEAQVRNEWVTELVLKDGTKLLGSATDTKDGVKLKLATVDGKTVRMGRESRDVPKKDIEQRIEHRDLPIDFGSGGVYNRQPARKVVSTDREWYTMTVVAHGNHIATWVNGYPVADYTDTRPANKSARNGTKTDKGVISLQGHDPTTDLSFRNIRIAELPKAGKP